MRACVRACTGTLTVDGLSGPYHRHVFWSALTGTCYLPSTVFPAGCGVESHLPIGLQVVGREGDDYITIDFCRLLEEECTGYSFVQPPPTAQAAWTTAATAATGDQQEEEGPKRDGGARL